MTDTGVLLLMGASLLLLLGLIVFFSWLTSLQEQHGSLPRAAAHSIKKYVAVNRYAENDAHVMSRSPASEPKKTDMEAVSIPVSDTSIETDIDEQMPRITAYLTDDEFLIFLVRQKLRDGKYRLSANKVYEVVGGNRNDVLDIVRQIRAAPDFPHRTPDQEQQRAELGLPVR